MSGGVEAGVSSPALGRAIELFSSMIDSPRKIVDGYIDLLGTTDVIDSRAMHQVVRKKNFPRIYERFWRPVVSRVLFGLFGMGPRKERQTMLGMLNVSPGDRVLDVGCGPGNYTRHLASASGSGLVVGVDASEAMLAAGVRLGGGPNLAFVRADACALPFADSGFDVVSCIGAIHMTTAPMEALAEMARVLAPGGRIGMMTTCGPGGVPTRVRNGITEFAPGELPEALSALGLGEIDQRVVRRAQFISARKLEEAPVGG